MPIRFFKVKETTDRPVIIVGGGPSLKNFPYNCLNGLGYVLAVKSAIFDIPFADAGFGLDRPRFREWWARLGNAGFPVYWAIDDGVPSRINHPIPSNVRLLRRERGTFLHKGPDTVCNGGTSGFGALNLAYILKPSAIFLFGFDYTRVDGEWHANESHYIAKRHQNPIRWKQWAKSYDTAAGQLKDAGIPVFNASPDSTVEAFPKVTHDEAIEHLDRLRSERD